MCAPVVLTTATSLPVVGELEWLSCSSAGPHGIQQLDRTGVTAAHGEHFSL